MTEYVTTTGTERTHGRPVFTEVRENIVRLMHKHGLDRKELAKRMRRSVSTVNRMLREPKFVNGISFTPPPYIRQRTADALCEALETTWPELCGRKIYWWRRLFRWTRKG